MKTRLVGIDPGKDGGIAIIFEDGRAEAYRYMDMQQAKETLAEILYYSGLDGAPVTAYLEEPATQVFLPNGKVIHAAKLMRHLGRLEGLLLAMDIRHYLVKPKAWQKGIPGLDGAKGNDRKIKLREHAARIFPNLKPTNKTADALLIAEWGRRQQK